MKIDVKLQIDDGCKKFLERVAKEYGSTGVEVGVTEYNGDDPEYPTYGEEPNREIPDIAQYALWNEFGTNTIPARPFLKNTVKEKARSWGEVFRNYAKDKIFVEGKAVDAWKAVGVAAKNDVLATIHAGVPPVNADSTIRAKTKKALGTDKETGKTVVLGESAPGTLIDTGDLIKSVTFQVIKK